MSKRGELSFSGPFVRLGNTFQDNEAPVLDRIPSEIFKVSDFAEISRGLLEQRKRNNPIVFNSLPKFLNDHKNGLIWRDVALLYAFSMPVKTIQTFANFFEETLKKEQDSFVAFHLLMMMMETGNPGLISSSLKLFDFIKDDYNWYEISANFAMIFEQDIEYDKSKSKIIDAFETDGKLGLRDIVQGFVERHNNGSSARIHAGKLFDCEQTVLNLADALKNPGFFEKIYFEKVLLEATTGFPFPNFYKNLGLQSAGAFEDLVGLSDSIDLSKFENGKRYFFGRSVEEF